MDKEKMTWRSFADDGSIVGTWNLPGTPTFYVIDHKGVIRHKWVGSPSDYKLGGLPDEKAIDSALEKLIRAAEEDRKKPPNCPRGRGRPGRRGLCPPTARPG